MAGAPHSDPDVSIIVVTYRSSAYIGECADAVRKASAGVSAEFIIVDNASGDGTADAARAAAPDAQVVENDRNGGFAYACHAGVARARGRLLWFVNPDAVPAPGSLAALLACARRNPRAGIVGGRSMLEDGTPDPRSWWGRPTFWSTLCFAFLLGSAFPGSRVFDPETPGPWTDEERQVPIVTGGFMLVDRALWDELGGFDQSIFMYGEDADLCLRARKAGFRPMVTARAEYRHEVGASSSSVRKLVLLFTGKVTVLRRHLPYGRRGAGVRLLTLGVLLRALLSRLVSARPQRQGRPTATGADWQGLWAARREWTAGWPVSQPRS